MPVTIWTPMTHHQFVCTRPCVNCQNIIVHMMRFSILYSLWYIKYFSFSSISLSECQDDAHLKNLLHPSYLIAVWHLVVESWVPFSIVLYEICNSPHTRHSSSMIIYNLYEKFAMNEQQSIFVQTSVTVQILFFKIFLGFLCFYCQLFTLDTWQINEVTQTIRKCSWCY